MGDNHAFTLPDRHVCEVCGGDADDDLLLCELCFSRLDEKFAGPVEKLLSEPAVRAIIDADEKH